MKINFFLLLFMLITVPAQAGDIGFVGKNGVMSFYVLPAVSVAHPVKRQHKKAATTYETIMNKAQSKYGIDKALIKAVIQAESGFNCKAVSPKGAKGLMQIMPGNNKALSITNPFDPEQNIMGGTRYLRALILRYDNKLAIALAAYNAGPDAVDKYGKRIPPYKETQDYIKKVIGLYKKYKQT